MLLRLLQVISYLSRKTPRHGAYQTHTIAEVHRSVKVRPPPIPVYGYSSGSWPFVGYSPQLPQSYTFEEGATVPLAYTTAGAGVVAALKVNLPALDGPIPVKPRNEPFLVWGGSSSVGAFGTAHLLHLGDDMRSDSMGAV